MPIVVSCPEIAISWLKAPPFKLVVYTEDGNVFVNNEGNVQSLLNCHHAYDGGNASCC